MAGNSAEMKVKATMDNSDLKKKAKESKDALKDFAKVGEDAVSSLGSAFGVNTGKIEQMMSAVRGLGENLSKSGITGVSALGNLLKGVNGLSAGIAGLGIGAAVAGFRMLKDEAENFKNTVAGANIELATTAYIETYKQVIHDSNAALGKGMTEAESKWKKFWGTIGSNIKAGITTGAFFADSSTQQGSQAWESYYKLVSEAKAAGEEAERLQSEILNLIDEASSKSVKWAKTERDIAGYKRTAYDTTVSTVERQKALADAQRLTEERYREEYDLRNKIATKTAQLNNLANSSREATHKENELRVQTDRILANMEDKLREMNSMQASLTTKAAAEAQARKEAAEAAAKMAKSKAEDKAWLAQATNVTPINLPTEAIAMNIPGIAIPLTPEVDPEEWTVTAEEINSMLSSYIDSMSQSLGGLVADLINGQNAWENFGSASLSALGDLAISFGKICVAAGLASEGIKQSLALHPVLALTAGAALIALGVAVKTSLSNISSGNYSSSASVATSTGSYGDRSSSIGTSFDTRDITVNVTGTLRADGNQLLTVIENENNRKKHTT